MGRSVDNYKTAAKQRIYDVRAECIKDNLVTHTPNHEHWLRIPAKPASSVGMRRF